MNFCVMLAMHSLVLSACPSSEMLMDTIRMYFALGQCIHDTKAAKNIHLPNVWYGL